MLINYDNYSNVQIISKFNLFILFNFNQAFGANNFNEWKIKFKARAINSGISEKVVNEIMADAIFLPKVIEYDRFQPEFYEDTFTYIKKIFQEQS